MKRVPRLLRKECPYKVLVKMKLIVVALIALASLQVHAGSYAQNTVTLSERNATLIKVFKQIKKQTGYSYILTSDLLAQAGKVSIEVTNVSLTDALEMIFRNQPLSYSIVGRTIVVKGKEEVKKATATAEITGQPIDVRGRVVNEKGEPVEGVTVTVKGTKKVTITNANGEFSLATVDPEAVLVFTSVNMETFEYEVSGRMEFVVNLRAKVSALGEVTVSVNTGYQDIPKERATGSFSQPDKKIVETRVATDILSKLDGITSGLSFNRNPATSSLELRVRGQSTIFSDAQPLIILDNFPYDGNLSNINPNDVETVTVLKDAAAASIWGSQAGNGVIVITTRKGKFNQPLRVTLNSNVTIAPRPDLFYDPNFMGSSAYIDLESILFNRGYYDAMLNNTLTFPAVTPVVEILAKRRVGSITSEEAAKQIDQFRGLDSRIDQQKYYYRKGLNQQHSIELSGGTEKSHQFFSFGYDKNIGSAYNNDLRRITLNLRNTFRPIKNLEATIGVIFTQIKSESGGSLSTKYPYQAIADESGNPLPIYSNFRKSFVDQAPSKGYLDWTYYPLRERDLIESKSKINDLRIQPSIKYNFSRSFSIEFKYQLGMALNQDEQWFDPNSYAVRNMINQYSSLTSGVVSARNVPVGGLMDLTNSQLRSQQGRAQLNYSKTWGRNDINVIAGINVSEVTTELNSSRLYGYNKDIGSFQNVNFVNSFNLNPGSGSSTIPSGVLSTGSLNRTRAYFTNASYTYNDKYTASVSGRIDQGNIFGATTNQRNLPLWSIGGMWNVDKEKFYSLNWIPKLRVRLTYGFQGNINNGVSAVATIRYSSIPAAFTNLSFATIDNYPNPELRWEKTSQLNLGVDFTVLDRITATIDIYRKKGVDLIGDAPLAPSAGLSNGGSSNINRIKGNFADMRGHGVDIQLVSVNVNRKLQWKTSFLYSYTTDKVVRYDLESKPIFLTRADGTVQPAIGRPVYSIFSYKWGGLDPATGDPRVILSDTLSSHTNTSSNNLKISDMVYSGTARPTVFGAVRNEFSYKGFTLWFNVSFKLNYYFRRSSLNYSSLLNNLGLGHKEFAYRWQKPGDESRTNVPSIPASTTASTRDDAYQYSTATVERGDHVRLQDISLSYLLTRRTWKRLPANSVQFYSYMNNIRMLWRANKLGIDPDLPSGGILPTRNVSFGIKANF